MKTEFLFLADVGGISFYHDDDSGYVGDDPLGAAPDLSLVYSANEIFPLVHDAAITRRRAATSHNVSSANIVAWEIFSWAFSDIFVALHKAERSKVLPLEAVVLYWANQFFGPPAAERQVILTIGQLSRPITYVTTLKNGQLLGNVLHGADTNKLFTRTCKEVVHVELLFDHPPDTAAIFNPPAADKSQSITLSQFVSECELRPITLGKRHATFPLSLVFYPLAAFTVVLAALYWADFYLQRKTDALKADVDGKHQEISLVQNEIQQEWRKALPFYIDRERKNINPTFKIIDAAAQILPLRNFGWDDKGVYYNVAFRMDIGALRAEQIRRRFADTFPDCEIKEKQTLGAGDEISFTINCPH